MRRVGGSVGATFPVAIRRLMEAHAFRTGSELFSVGATPVDCVAISRSALMPTMDNVAEDVRRSGHSRVWWLDRPHVLISRRVSQTADWDLSIFKVSRSTTLASRPIVRSHLPPLHHRGV